jgi:tyrosine-protein kinase Etk/Wzc
LEKNIKHIPDDLGLQKKPSRTISPLEFVFKYLRFIPWVLLSAALFIVIAFLKVRYTVQIFHVQSSMLIKNDEDNLNVKDQKFSALFMTQGATNLSNEIEILRSTPVMQRVAKDLGLQTRYYIKGSVKVSLAYPDFPFDLDIIKLADSTKPLAFKLQVLNDRQFIVNEEKKPVEFGEIVERNGNKYRLHLKPEVNINIYNSLIFNVLWLPLPDAASDLIQGLRISQTNEQSTILTLSYENENPTLGRNVLNTLMAVYDTLVIEDKNRIANNTLVFINARVAELGDSLRSAQGEIRNFMVTNQVFDLDNQSKVYLDKMGDASKQQSEMEVKISILNYLQQYVSDKKNIHELVPTNLGIEEPALLQLIQQYNHLVLERDHNIRTTPAGNPLITDMDNTLEKIRRDIVQALNNVKAAYSISANRLKSNDDQLKGLLTSMPGKSMQLLNKGRQQKILEDLYSVLLQKKLEITLSSASTISNSTVVEPATNNGYQVSPDPKKIYSFYFIIGLLIPIGIIAVRELLQDKVNGRADVEKITSAPILGEIGHASEEGTLIVTKNSRRLISEQFRIIRTNLQFIIGQKKNPTILVTSSFSGEGKSFVSTNIGAVMALSGRKTVIMEFDIRKPKIISGLELKRKSGITNYIIGKASFDEMVVKVPEVENLYVIPCGPIPPNPAELLLDERLEQLMKQVKEQFEVVILDTAPIGLVSDATTLCRFADCTLYIVRQGHTFRNQVHLIDELYTEKKLPSLSILLNDVHSGGRYPGYYGSGYGYYGGYSYGRGSGYFEEDQKKKPKMRLFSFFSRLFK